MDFDLIHELGKLKDSETLIIVEGKKDKSALSSLGITNVAMLNSSIFNFCEMVSRFNKEVIILTDLDKEGKMLYAKLKCNFSKVGVKVDDKFRTMLYRYTKLRQIEGIVSYIDKVNT